MSQYHNTRDLPYSTYRDPIVRRLVSSSSSKPSRASQRPRPERKPSSLRDTVNPDGLWPRWQRTLNDPESDLSELNFTQEDLTEANRSEETLDTYTKWHRRITDEIKSRRNNRVDATTMRQMAATLDRKIRHTQPETVTRQSYVRPQCLSENEYNALYHSVNNADTPRERTKNWSLRWLSCRSSLSVKGYEVVS